MSELFKRKIQEVLLAFWLDAKFSKDQILELYLNRSYFGGGAYGLSAASRHYFQKSANNLSLDEAALIIGLLKAPTSYSPVAHPQLSVQRTHQVIKNYINAGYGYAQQQTQFQYPNLKVNQHSSSFARFYCDYVLSELEEVLGPISDDITVSTNCNIHSQLLAEKVITTKVSENKDKLNVQQGAGIIIDKSGAILALVGGIDYFSSPFNRAFQSTRQTGSAFKMFIYLCAFEKGWQLDDLISDMPVSYKNWRPKNFGWVTQGDITLQDAFAFSVNTCAIRLAQDVNVTTIKHMVERFHIFTPQPHDLTITLGTGEASLLKLSAAYATINNDGIYLKPFAIKTVKTINGNVLYRHKSNHIQLISHETSQKMRRLLSAVMGYGTGRHHRISQESYGKTGTTQNHRDAWFIGFNDNVTTGIWVGNDHNQPMKKVSGSGLPCLIWQTIMQQN